MGTEHFTEAEKSKLYDEFTLLTVELLIYKESLSDDQKVQKIARVKEIKSILHCGELPQEHAP